ncbi:MAG: hypothetical protein RR768_10880 [Clostridium sp.]
MNKKNLVVFAMAAICVAGLSACGGKKEAETTVAETTVVETTVAETTAAETTAAETTAAVAVGEIDANGKFTSADGAYEITLPAGWVVSPDSEEGLVCLTSADEKDIIEIISENGDDAAAMLVTFPETAEEYNKSKELPAKEITKYSIMKDAEEGVETFQIYSKFDKADGKTPYTFTALSGVQDATDKIYYAANALIQSEGMEDTITKTMDSFAMLNLQ